MFGSRRFGFAVALVGAALTAGAAAGATGEPDYRYAKTAADEALAARLVLTRPDLPGLRTWKGGFVKPDESPSSDPCEFGGTPAKSVPVVTGHKETKYTFGPSTLQTEAQVLQSAAMIDQDWGGVRNATALMVRCFKAHSPAPAGAKVVSVAPLSIAHGEPRWLAVRVVLEGTVSAQHFRMAIDALGFARGRSETMVICSGLIFSQTDLTMLHLLDQKVHDILATKLSAAA